MMKSIARPLIVLGVIALVVVVLAPLSVKEIRVALLNAKIAKTQGVLSAIDVALDNYYSEYKEYPVGDATAVLTTLYEDDKHPEKIRFLEQGYEIDPWGHRIIMKSRVIGAKAEFYSSGPDGIDNKCSAGSDDIERLRR